MISWPRNPNSVPGVPFITVLPDPVPLPLEELIQVASLGERQLRRYEDIGLERLADWLRREEMAIHHRHHTLRLRRHLPPTIIISCLA